MSSKVPEKLIVKSILEYYALFPAKIKLWRNNSGAMQTFDKRWISFGLKGSPDIIGFIAPSGRFVGIECKVVGDKPKPHQQAFLDNIQDKGGISIVAYDLEDVKQALEELK
jgi:hypothetical protein